MTSLWGTQELIQTGVVEATERSRVRLRALCCGYWRAWLRGLGKQASRQRTLELVWHMHPSLDSGRHAGAEPGGWASCRHLAPRRKGKRDGRREARLGCLGTQPGLPVPSGASSQSAVWEKPGCKGKGVHKAGGRGGGRSAEPRLGGVPKEHVRGLQDERRRGGMGCPARLAVTFPLGCIQTWV